MALLFRAPELSLCALKKMPDLITIKLVSGFKMSAKEWLSLADLLLARFDGQASARYRAIVAEDEVNDFLHYQQT